MSRESGRTALRIALIAAKRENHLRMDARMVDTTVGGLILKANFETASKNMRMRVGDASNSGATEVSPHFLQGEA